MKARGLLFCFLGVFLMSSAFVVLEPQWGFWGHRKINRMATFTLPQELFAFYKNNIEYVTAHAIDPDKRRYASKFEAVRHYIDLDHWGEYPFDNVPRKFTAALMKFSDIYLVSGLDTTQIYESGSMDFRDSDTIDSTLFDKSEYDSLWYNTISRNYYEDEWVVDVKDAVRAIKLTDSNYDDNSKLLFVDNLSPQGILPYHLVKTQRQLAKAFEEKNEKRILQISSDFGHYIADAHVPLHTTKNYNGQMTDQLGIHAFWESRIPELFATEQYDFFVGRAEYIEDPTEYYWDIVLKSHSYVDSVLTIEKELNQDLGSDRKYCYEERLNRTIRTECTEYAAAYQERLRGMVEERMRGSIQSIGSAWFTAWVDAGQPRLDFDGEIEAVILDEAQEREQMELLKQSGKAKGRDHN